MSSGRQLTGRWCSVLLRIVVARSSKWWILQWSLSLQGGRSPRPWTNLGRILQVCQRLRLLYRHGWRPACKTTFRLFLTRLSRALKLLTTMWRVISFHWGRRCPKMFDGYVRKFPSVLMLCDGMNLDWLKYQVLNNRQVEASFDWVHNDKCFLYILFFPLFNFSNDVDGVLLKVLGWINCGFCDVYSYPRTTYIRWRSLPTCFTIWTTVYLWGLFFSWAPCPGRHRLLWCSCRTSSMTMLVDCLLKCPLQVAWCLVPAL